MTETGAFQQMGAFSMGESGKAEVWAEGQVVVKEETDEAVFTLIPKRQGLASSVMAKAILLKFAQVNLRAKLSQHTSVTHRLRPKHVLVLCLKNSLRMTGGHSVTNGMTTPEACVLTDVSFNKFRQREEEFWVGGIIMCLPTAPT